MLEVADAAGVSPATVSRVMSDSPYPVRPETRELVLRAAERLGFQPSRVARALATSRTSIVGAIVHDISDPYFGEVVRGIEEVAHAEDYQVFVSSSDRHPDREIEVLKLMLAYQVDVVLLAGGSFDDRGYQQACKQLFDSFREQGKAVVTLSPHHVKTTRVTIDNEAAAAEMVGHLAELGHERIALLDGPTGLSTANLRADGYRKGLADAGLAYDPDLVACGDFNSPMGRIATAQLLERCPDLTAIFASNDLMALGALMELRTRGIQVPEDVSIAGFDDVKTLQYAWPGLTTVAVPMSDLGRTGLEVALRRLDGHRVRSRTLPSRLVVRASTGPPR